MGGVVAGEELGPPLGNDFAPRIELLSRDLRVNELHAAEIVVRMDVSDPFYVGPSSGCGRHARHTASDERIFVTRNTYFGFLTTTSKRWSVQPSVKIVGISSSSATGASATVSPAEITPVNQSMPSDSFILLSSLTLPSTPAASSAAIVTILRAPRNPPSALISSAARVCPFNAGAPRAAPGPD